MIHEELIAQCKANASDRPYLLDLAEMLQHPAVVCSMRNFYKSSLLVKMAIRARKQRTLNAIENMSLDPGTECELARLILHTIQQLKVHEHAHDLDVRRWAQTANALAANDNVMRSAVFAMAQLIDDSSLRSALQVWLHSTLSECNNRKCPVMPF